MSDVNVAHERVEVQAAKKRRRARIYYTAGPGGLIRSYQHWRDGNITTDVAVTGVQIVPRLPELEAAALRRAGGGAWQPLVQEFSLAAAPDAHHAIETRATTGKVVLVP